MFARNAYVLYTKLIPQVPDRGEQVPLAAADLKA
jgi:hypothetical protein